MLARAFLVLAVLAQSGEGIQTSSKRWDPYDVNYFPMKGGDERRSSYMDIDAPTQMDIPVWTFEEPDRELRGKRSFGAKVFRTTPLIDAAKNIYVTSTTGWIYSLSKKGKLRWEFKLFGIRPSNPVLQDDMLFISCNTGHAYGINTTSGEKMWHVKVGKFGPGDMSALAVQDNVLLVPVRRHWKYRSDIGVTDLVALDTRTAKTKWTYYLGNKHEEGSMRSYAYNMMPVLYGRTVLFNDIFGGVYRLHMDDGKEMWYTPGSDHHSFTTGGVVMGPDKMAYVTSNLGWMNHANGLLRALHVDDGRKVWQRQFNDEINTPPAVGPVTKDGTVGVVVATGVNPHPDPDLHHIFQKFWHFPVTNKANFIGQVHAVHPDDGATLWHFSTDQLGETFGADSDWQLNDKCWPDHWASPLIGKKGTVYMNWSGGRLFAIKGKLDSGEMKWNDIRFSSNFHHQEGATGQPASAPGLLVVASCRKIMAFMGA